MESSKGTVCVTGGTGYLATWTITRLLEQGYSVRATVRPILVSTPIAIPIRLKPMDALETRCLLLVCFPWHVDGKRDISFLTNLAKEPQSLQIFHAHLDDPESFAPAVEGCVGVFKY